MPKLAIVALLAVAVGLSATAIATADPAGKTTLTETINPSGSGFRGESTGRGQAFVVRRGNAGPRSSRTRTRRSLAFFGQFTDPQIVDEMSPLRPEFVDPVAEPGSSASGLGSAWRPQEALGLQTFDATIRNMNANRTSPVRQGNGARSRLQIAVTTGDMADNQQQNETRWFVRTLNGGQVDPFSGQPISPTNPCSTKNQGETNKLNAAVAARSYTGVQDFDDWRGRPADRYAGFWDPDEAGPGPATGPYASFPRYPGLMDRAQRVFTAQGSRVPWFISRGNHDGETQGSVASTNPLLVSLATGCLKVFPSQAFDPATQKGKTSEQVVMGFLEPNTLSALLSGGENVPPDPDRRLINKVEYKREVGHGFTRVDRAQNTASAGTATYYSFVRGRIRFISIDTVAEGGGAEGNIDDPQYRWIESELRKAKAARQLVIPFGHHTLRTMRNTAEDEKAGKCEGNPPLPGCDADPRNSKPIHRGLAGPKTMRDLFAKYPNVIAYVAGHTHDNRITPYFRRGKGLWEINTASHIDWPQNSRQIDVMDNRDGTLSIFSWVLDQSAKLATPAAGSSATGFSDLDLAAVSRRLALNDPQAGTNNNPAGRPADRNVELLIRDPR